MIEEALWSGLRGALPMVGVVVLGMVVIAVLKLRLMPDRKPPVTYPFARRTALFSQTEARLYWALCEAVPQLQVLGKVRLEDVIGVRRGLSRSDFQAARNRIKSRHVDFVLVDPASSWILCAIELDDASHDRAGARLADQFKDRAFEAAGVPLLRIRASAAYSSVELARIIKQLADLPGKQKTSSLSMPGPYEMPGDDQLPRFEGHRSPGASATRSSYWRTSA